MNPWQWNGKSIYQKQIAKLTMYVHMNTSKPVELLPCTTSGMFSNSSISIPWPFIWVHLAILCKLPEIIHLLMSYHGIPQDASHYKAPSHTSARLPVCLSIVCSASLRTPTRWSDCAHRTRYIHSDEMHCVTWEMHFLLIRNEERGRARFQVWILSVYEY